MRKSSDGQRSAPATRRTVTAGTSLRFVVLLGVVSLLADMTYEGARSITGPYLAVLGAGGLAVGVIAGAGELAGYGLRLAFGRLFDRRGLPVLAAATVLSAAFAPLVFLGGPGLALAGVVLWGVGLGAHESVMRAAVAGLAPADRRASAYGLFNAGYGLAWFAGSAALGLLYDLSIPALVGVSVALQAAALPLLVRLRQAR